MKRFKLFIENFLVYGFGSILSKLIPLIMLPIITRMMPDTTYFGVNDLMLSVASICSSIAVFGMYDAMFRMFFEKEKEEYKKTICSSALGFVLMNALIIVMVLVIFRKEFASLIFGSDQYETLVILAAVNVLIGTSNNIVAAPTRMQNKRKVYLFTNVFSAIAAYAITFFLLKKGYYLLALPLGTILSAVIVEVYFLCANRQWFCLKFLDKKSIRQMIMLGAPLVPNFLIYWVFNSSDRLMITHMLGNDYTGIYAVGAKVAHISYLIQSAFAGGWQFFAFSTMKDDDQVKMTSNIFEYLAVIAFAASILMTSVNYLLFKIFFVGDYVQGYIVAPWLFLAPLIQMLYQVIGNQFLVIKKTWPSMIILGGGALFNVCANLLLIPSIGIEGAAIATLVGFLVSVFIAIIVLEKMKLICITKRFYIVFLITIFYMVCWRIFFDKKTFVAVFLAIVAIVLQIYTYRTDLYDLFKNLKKRYAAGNS